MFSLLIFMLDAGIVGEWEASHEGAGLTLVCFEDGTGVAGGEGMESNKISWEKVGDEFKLTGPDGITVVMGRMENDNLVLWQPANPERGEVKFARKNSADESAARDR